MSARNGDDIVRKTGLIPIHGLEYCVLNRILSLNSHFAAFSVDAVHFDTVIGDLQQELQCLVNWITPKLMVKQQDKSVDEVGAMSRDNLWIAINTVYREQRIDILKAISIHCAANVFVLWFKYLLTAHFKAAAAKKREHQNDGKNGTKNDEKKKMKKMNEINKMNGIEGVETFDIMNPVDRSQNELKVDVLMEQWFWERVNVRMTASNEILKVLQSDCTVLVQDAKGLKGPDLWIHELHDEVLRFMDIMDNRSESKVSLLSTKSVHRLMNNVTLKRMQREYGDSEWNQLRCSMLELMAPFFPRWTFLIEFLGDILDGDGGREQEGGQHAKYQERIVALCLLLDSMLIRPLMLFMTMSMEQRKAICGDDEDGADEFEENIETLKAFMESVYSVFVRGVERLDLDKVDVEFMCKLQFASLLSGAML